MSGSNSFRIYLVTMALVPMALSALYLVTMDLSAIYLVTMDHPVSIVIEEGGLHRWIMILGQ